MTGRMRSCGWGAVYASARTSCTWSSGAAMIRSRTSRGVVVAELHALEVEEREPAEAGELGGQPDVGDRVHRRGDDRELEADAAEVLREDDVGRVDRVRAGGERDVLEAVGRADRVHLRAEDPPVRQRLGHAVVLRAMSSLHVVTDSLLADDPAPILVITLRARSDRAPAGSNEAAPMAKGTARRRRAAAKGAAAEPVALPAKPKLKRKAYLDELAKLSVELSKLQEWIRARGLKVVIVFEGRDAAGKGGVDQDDHRGPQPARRRGRRPAGAVRTGAVAVVLPALRRAPARGRRDGPARPQLVQPRRRRARDGLRDRRGGPGVLSAPARSSSGCSCAPGSSSSSTGSRSATPSRSAGSRPASTTRRSAGS